jgi:hypothetical protein
MLRFHPIAAYHPALDYQAVGQHPRYWQALAKLVGVSPEP